MSERTTIGGTVYESIGSSSSNLLLKCNGTARIQWGNRLIDLIKNGKIASGDSSTKISVISDESEITSDGIYVLNKDESSQLIIYKDDEQYNVTNTDLYISAKTKQDITVEQRQQALENIGMYYNTLEEVQQAGIQNGLVYVLSDQALYTVKDGVVAEFEAKLKTVTVEKEQQEGEIIKSAVNIILSVADSDYMIIGNGQILVNYTVSVKESAKIESEGASDTLGYRLYVDSLGSHLDVDYINVRTGIVTLDYIEVTYDELCSKLNSGQLIVNKWYVITDYQNPWNLVSDSSEYRPIMVQALTTNTLYPKGKLFKDNRVSLNYDHTYHVSVRGESSGVEFTTKGLITQMTDANNNTANFDFLDYGTSVYADIVLHESVENSSLDSSIFPIGSYNNTLIINDLKGTVVNTDDSTLGGTSLINFKFREVYEDESQPERRMQMHDNYITCSGLILEESCDTFVGNTIANITHNTTIKGNVINSVFGNVDSTTVFNGGFDSVQFNSISNCVFGEEIIYDSVFHNDLTTISEINKSTYPLLYTSGISKNVYVVDNTLQILVTKEQAFLSGMIIMYNGIASNIPDGWAICDGTNGTPDLRGKFIKADYENVGASGGSSSITLTTKQLPKHYHTYSVGEAIEFREGDKSKEKLLKSGTLGAMTSYTGEGDPIPIEPPYYALIFIMKL
jgi:hypothetical protein